jgi:hypothetical protein
MILPNGFLNSKFWLCHMVTCTGYIWLCQMVTCTGNNLRC